MRINNQTLVQTFLNTTIKTNDLIVYFDIIIKLIKKYKKKLIIPDVLVIIKSVDDNLYTLLMILDHYDKLSISSVKTIISEIKTQSKEYVPTFTVNIIEHSQKHDIEKLLTDKFPKCTVKKNQNIDLWAYIHWEWWYYKRNIDQDLQKLLW